jgi:hypothetical protein
MASVETSSNIPLDNPLDWFKEEYLRTKFLLASLLRIGSYADSYDYSKTNPHPAIRPGYFLVSVHEEIENLQEQLKNPTERMQRIVDYESKMKPPSTQFDSDRSFEFTSEIIVEIANGLTFEQRFLLAAGIRLCQKQYGHEYWKRNPHRMIGKDAFKTSLMDEFWEISNILDNISTKQEVMQRVIDAISK